MDSVREDIKRLINEKAKDLTPAEKKLQEDALVKIMEGTHTPMEAMGLTNEEAEASIRVSIGKNNTQEEILMACKAIEEAVKVC